MSGDLYTHWYIIAMILIAWGSERFYFLIFGSEDLKVCSKSVLAQELWSYGVRTRKGCGKLEVSSEGGKNVCTTEWLLFSSVGLPWRSRQPPSALILEKQGTSLSQNIYTTKFCVVVAIGEDSFVK